MDSILSPEVVWDMVCRYQFRGVTFEIPVYPSFEEMCNQGRRSDVFKIAWEEEEYNK